MAKKILITGASGFVGGGLTRYFAARGWEVTGTGRKSISEKNYVRADLAVGPEESLRLLGSGRFDFVLHCAGVKDVRWCEAHESEARRINAETTRWLARATALAEAKFVYLSTDLVFAADRGTYREEDLLDGKTAYGRTKAEGERFALEECMDCLVCRTGGVFGMGSPLFNWLLGELQEGKNLEAFADVKNSPTYLPDLGQMLERLMINGEQGIFHTCGPETVTRYDWFKAFARAAGFPEEMVRPAKAEGRHGELLLFPNSSLNSARAYAATEFRPHSVTEALAEMATGTK